MVNDLLQKVEGIVIRCIDYGETNKIVTLLTRELGKVSVMARGAKKANSRLAAMTQLFTYGYFLVQKSHGIGALQQGEIISSMKDIRQDIVVTAYASLVIEVTDKALEDKKHNPYLFELLYQTLNYMEEGLDAEVLSLIYQLKLLPVLGLYPIIDTCASCHDSTEFVAFSIREGGFLCKRCIHNDPYHLKMNETAMKLIRVFYHFDLVRLGNISVKKENKRQIRKIIDIYYDEYAGMYLKSRRFLNQLDFFDTNE
jgi:DNA repair protein RecO (recombination protein O)